MSFPLVGLKLGHYSPGSPLGTVKGRSENAWLKNGVSPAHPPASLEVHLSSHLCLPPWPVHPSPPISTTTNSTSHPSAGPGLRHSWNQREAEEEHWAECQDAPIPLPALLVPAVWPEASYSPPLVPGYPPECESPASAFLARERGRAGVRTKAREGWPPSSLAPKA